MSEQERVNVYLVQCQDSPDEQWETVGWSYTHKGAQLERDLWRKASPYNCTFRIKAATIRDSSFDEAQS